MKVVRFHEWGNVDVVKVEDIEPVQPKVGEVLVKVHAAGINPIDWKVREGNYAAYLSDCFPFPMGWDFSGTIISEGNYLSFKKGDEVFGLIRFFAPAGTFAEYVTAPVTEICHKPTNIDHIHAAATPLVALTAWQALFEVAELQANQTVMVHAAGGGVGQFAVQLAKYKGAKVIAVASNASKDLLHSFGVDQFIDYQHSSFEDKAEDVDVVLSLVGDKDTAIRSLKTMKRGGKIISFLGPHDPEVVDLAKNKEVLTPAMIVKPNGEQLLKIAQLMHDDLLKTTVEKVFTLNEVKSALDLVQTGHCHGKVVLKVI